MAVVHTSEDDNLALEAGQLLVLDQKLLQAHGVDGVDGREGVVGGVDALEVIEEDEVSRVLSSLGRSEDGFLYCSYCFDTCQTLTDVPVSTASIRTLSRL